MKFILLSITMISVSCGTEVMAEPEQIIIKQDVEKSILCAPIGESGFCYLWAFNPYSCQAIVKWIPLPQRFQLLLRQA